MQGVFMRRCLLTIVFVVGTVSCLFTQTLRGRVLDLATKKPISFAEIQLVDLNVNFTSDKLGFFIYSEPIPPKAHLIFMATGYESKQLIIDDLSKEISIYLIKNHIELHEINIAYSKDSLSLMKNTNGERFQLNELNSIAATTMGELISKVPGVYRVSFPKN